MGSNVMTQMQKSEKNAKNAKNGKNITQITSFYKIEKKTEGEIFVQHLKMTV